MCADRVVRYVFKGDIGDISAKMSALGKSVGHAADKMTAADKAGVQFRRNLSTVGDSARTVGLVTAAGIGVAVAAAANFEAAMSQMQAATRASASDLDALRQAAIQAGEDTVFSATEAAGAITSLSKAGVSTQDILGGGLTGALDLAAAGQIEVGEAAEYASKAMTMFGLKGSDVGHVADLLAAAAGKAVGEVGDFGQALAQSGLVADQVGLSIEETTGALAAFASAGLLGSDAGTSLKTMLGALTPNSKRAAETMRELGIRAYDAQGNFVGLAQFAGNLRDGLDDLTVQQRQAAMETIFGSDAVRAASILYEQGAKGIAGWVDSVDDSGYAAETAATATDNLKGDLEAFKGSLETALIGAGTGAQGPLRDLVQGATSAVNAFGDLPEPIQDASAALVGLTAVGGGSVWAFTKVVGTVADARIALSNLGTAADGTRTKLGAVGSFLGGPWGIALAAGVGALGLFAKKQAEGAEAVDAMKATLDQQTGALTENSRAWAVKKLMDEGVLEAARGLGLDLEAVTDAALGQKGAVAEVNAELERLIENSIQTGKDGRTIIDRETNKAAVALRDTLISTNGTIADAREEWHLEKEAMGDAALAAAEARTEHLATAAGVIATARAAGLGKAAMRDLIAEYELTPEEVRTLVHVDTDRALSELNLLDAKLDWITRPRSARIEIAQIYSSSGRQTTGGLQRAHGGYISGPGGPTEDRIPAYLSNGEYVVRAAAVDRYGIGLLDRLNSMQLAAGGLVPTIGKAAR